MKVVMTLAATAIALLSVNLPAGAQTSGYYQAVAATPVAKNMLVTRDTVWRCADTTCVAPKSTARDTIMCELIVQRTGALTAFSANGAQFDAAALDRCNARAK